MFPSIFNLQFYQVEWEKGKEAHGPVKLDEIIVWVKAS